MWCTGEGPPDPPPVCEYCEGDGCPYCPDLEGDPEAEYQALLDAAELRAQTAYDGGIQITDTGYINPK